jgi:hypothetical protein
MKYYLLLLLLLAGCTFSVPKDRTIELPTKKYSEQHIQQRVIRDGKVYRLICQLEEEDG